MNRRNFSKKFGIITILSALGFNKSSNAQEKKKNPYPHRNDDKFIEPSLSDKKSATIVLVGDTQRYSNDSVFQSVCDMIYAWIAKKRDYLNIKTALFTGDLVENNNYPNVRIGGAFGDAELNSDGQWKYVDTVFKKLDGKLPYIISPGNHEYGIKCFENRDTRFTKVFTKDRNPLTKGILVEMFTNAYGEQTLENACYKVDLGNAWGEVIIFAIEFCPRDVVLEWVKQKCQKDFADKKVFLLLHDFLKMNGERTGLPNFPRNYVVMHNQPDKNGGQTVWEKLVKKVPNIRLVLCGHTGGRTTSIDDNSKTIFEKNDFGKDVAQMVFAQHGRAHDGHGANGWLRTLEFLPDGKTVKVMTFSPYLFFSLDTKVQSCPRNQNNHFTFVIE